MAYSPQHVANFFLDAAEAEGRTLDPLKLMKLVYIGYGWVLSLTGRRLFEEPILAWKHGPVVRSIYDEFKRYRSGSITHRATEFDLDTWEQVEPSIPPEDDVARMILGKAWAAYKGFSGWQLRNKTHEAGTPWTMTYDPNRRDLVIPDQRIADHFRSKIRDILDAARLAPAA